MITQPILNLSTKQRRLVRESFASVKEYETAVVMLFYGRLFEIAPETRQLFNIDMNEQSHKLLDTLATVVSDLDRFDNLVPFLVDLGRRHTKYGVQSYQYGRLSAALLWAFGQALGLEFDGETRAAWQQLLDAITAVMLEDSPLLSPPS